MRLPHTTPYHGSKRNLAHCILPFFPAKFNRLIEPFAGSAAISIATAFHGMASQFILNDINKPLAHLLEMIVSNPMAMVEAYEQTWNNQHYNPEHYYKWIRKRFNATQRPEDLLYLLARCNKSAVRYNAQGFFNQSPDKRLLGRHPDRMKSDLLQVSKLLKGKTRCYTFDYQEVLPIATADDLVYLDPPYEGTGTTGGFNYAGKIDFKELVYSLGYLNDRNIPYLLSFSGRTGSKLFGKPLPTQLGLTKLEINTGQSPQARFLSRVSVTYESLYLSSALVSKIDLHKVVQTHAAGFNPYIIRRRKSKSYHYAITHAKASSTTNLVMAE